MNYRKRSKVIPAWWEYAENAVDNSETDITNGMEWGHYKALYPGLDIDWLETLCDIWEINNGAEYPPDGIPNN